MEIKVKKKQSKVKPALVLDNPPVFSTIGLVSSSALHKIAWQLNESFGFDLEANIELSEYLQLPSNGLVYVGKDRKSNIVLFLPPFFKTTKAKKTNKSKIMFDFILIFTKQKNEHLVEYLGGIKKIPLIQFSSLYPDNVPFADDWLVLI